MKRRIGVKKGDNIELMVISKDIQQDPSVTTCTSNGNFHLI